jgi:hypothetical protein
MVSLELILKEKKIKGFSWKKLAENLPISGDSLRIAFKRESVDSVYLEKICDLLDLVNNEQNEKNEKNITYKSEGKIIDDKDYPSKIVHVIPIKGRGGLEDSYFADEVITKLEKEKLTIKEESSNGSTWFKIEVEGISMDDSTKDYDGSKYSLCEGDWTYCRSIPRIHWKNKLHFNSVKAFCFFHNSRGIIFKKVKSHNLENGELVLSSLNPDKKQFPDFTINIGECSYICNVRQVLTEF